jgi:hypothetical protein
MTHCLINHHTTSHLMFVLVSTEYVMLCRAINDVIPSTLSLR